MRNILTSLFIAGSASLLVSTSTALSQATPSTPAETTNAAPVSTGSAKIQFVNETYDFGRVSAGQVVRADFVFTNTGTTTLEITAVRPSCGCTTAGTWDQKVEPGKTGTIPLQVNTANFNGGVSKSATVTCNDPDHGSIILHINGTVWRAIEATPNFVTFSFPTGGQTNETRTVRIVNNTDEPLTLTDVQSGNPAFTAVLKTVETNKVFDLEISTVGSVITATTQTAVTVKTSSTNVPLVSVTAMAIIQPPPQPVAQPTPPPAATPAPPHS